MAPLPYFQDVLTLSATATGLVAANDLVGFDDAKVAADDAAVKGVAKHPATEIGMQIGVIAIGVARVKAVGVITVGAPLISAAAGGVKVAGATPANAFATALTAAGDGEYVEILIR